MSSLLTDAPPTASSPNARVLWRSARVPALVAALLFLVALAAALSQETGPSGTLDPDAVDDNGSRALATLLRERGVDVTKVSTVDEAVAGGGAGTVLVTFPALLDEVALRTLRTSSLDLVVLSPDDTTLQGLGVRIAVADLVDTGTRDPACGWPVATAAGRVDLGGYAYVAEDPSAVRCYPVDRAALVVHSDQGGRAVTVVGNGAPWTNGRLADEGNAAFGLMLLGEHPRLRWLVPDPARGGGDTGLLQLLPDRVVLAGAHVVLVVLVVGLWRSRRLGPVIVEPLPVVVRAAETVTGRAALYRAARARDRAADALRAGCRRRLAAALGVPVDANREALVEAVATRSRRAGREVDGLLYGAAPHDDAALVRLADALDDLDREVRRP